jgi:pheromone shutdown protein TraB
MTESPPLDDPGAVLSDPRVDPDQLRSFAGPTGNPILLVGCVHDHPASVYRVRSLVESLVPDVVGVELPGPALPIFERVGRESTGDATLGGEMSEALAAGAAVGAERVGIDTLDARFFRSLVWELRRESPPVGTLKRVFASVTDVCRHALTCRLSAALGRFGTATPVRRRAYDHEVDERTPPAAQADDERRQLTRSLSVLRALEQPVANQAVDTARERTMVTNLTAHSKGGSVIAVVGFDHLSEVSGLLEDRCHTSHDVDRESLARLWG